MDRPLVRGGEFSDVDAHDTNALIAYLDLATDLSSHDKRESYRAQGIGPNMHVLDVGCGTGDDVRAMAALVGPGGSVAGIDPSTAMIEEARRRGVPSNARFEQGAAARLAFEDGAFDACRAERVFQHLHDPAAAACELYRVSKAGGSVLLIDQDWETLTIAGGRPDITRRVVHAYAERLASGSAGSEHRRWLRRAGFTSISTHAIAAMPNLTTAFSQFLNAGIDYALEAAAIETNDAHEWLLSLLQAEAAGEFTCAVTAFFSLARR